MSLQQAFGFGYLVSTLVFVITISLLDWYLSI